MAYIAKELENKTYSHLKKSYEPYEIEFIRRKERDLFFKASYSQGKGLDTAERAQIQKEAQISVKRAASEMARDLEKIHPKELTL